MKIKQNDSFNGKKTASSADVDRNLRESINHNSRADLGLGAFLARPVGSGSLKTGFCVTLPVGGDRYNWSSDDTSDSYGKYLSGRVTEAYKNLNLVMAVPIIFNISL